MPGVLSPGETFAGLEIKRLLGQGGMGEVYLAHEKGLDRLVALKLVTVSAQPDLELQKRFEVEARAAARLTHPNIVPVHGKGKERGFAWLSMAYIEGSDANSLIKAGPMAPGRAARVVADSAAALDFAHGKGVLHRDVKPQNILVADGPQERAVLCDFGIAKILDETTLTATGVIAASWHYAAPERFVAPWSVDSRADVYSLGCTLYHLLTGEVPYPGTNIGQLAYSHVHGEIPKATQHNPSLPRAVDDVIAKSLAKAPADRYADCNSMSEALAAALEGYGPERTVRITGSGNASARTPGAENVSIKQAALGLTALVGSLAFLAGALLCAILAMGNARLISPGTATILSCPSGNSGSCTASFAPSDGGSAFTAPMDGYYSYTVGDEYDAWLLPSFMRVNGDIETENAGWYTLLLAAPAIGLAYGCIATLRVTWAKIREGASGWPG